MTKERKTEIKVGLTTILSLIIFLWILAWAKNLIVSPSNTEIRLNFDNVSGLEEGDEVTVNGLRKGFVKDINLDRNIIIVTLSVEEGVDLRKDAEFFISTIDLMGDKKIEIHPGNSPESLDLSHMHRGKFIPDLTSVMQLVGSFENDVRTMMKDMKSALSSISGILTDEEMVSNLKSSLKNLDEVSSRMNIMLKNNEENIGKITENTAQLTESTKNFYDKNEQTLQESVDNLHSVISSSDSLINRLNSIVTETSEGKNNLGKILNDDSLYVNLKNSLDLLKKLTELVLKQLQTDGLNIDAHIF